jgi:hypothetical protein
MARSSNKQSTSAPPADTVARSPHATRILRKKKLHKETSEVDKAPQLLEKKVPEKKAPGNSKLSAAPSNNESSGGSEEASESSDEEVS